GTDIGFSAQDWTNAWRAGSIDFTDQYYLAHKGKPLPKDDLDRLQTYIYLNRLDPMVVQNWNAAYERLVAAGVIMPEARKPPVKPPVQEEEQEPQGRRWIDVEKMSSRTPDERNALKSAM